MKSVKLASVTLHYHDVGPVHDVGTDHNVGTDGGGKPATILFIHGFPLDHSMWQSQLDALAPSVRCLAPDLRGFGRSKIDDGQATDVIAMSQFADDIAELLEHSCQQPVVVCGLSMGGYIAFELWQRHPARVSGLIFCDTRATADSTEVSRGRELMADQVERDGMKGVSTGMLTKLVSQQTRTQQPKLVETLGQVIDETDAAVVAAAQRGMAKRADFSDRLEKIQIPTLVVCGGEDVITPPNEMKELTRSLPQSDYLELPGVGHLAPLESPELVNVGICKWLQTWA